MLNRMNRFIAKMNRPKPNFEVYLSVAQREQLQGKTRGFGRKVVALAMVVGIGAGLNLAAKTDVSPVSQKAAPAVTLSQDARDLAYLRAMTRIDELGGLGWLYKALSQANKTAEGTLTIRFKDGELHAGSFGKTDTVLDAGYDGSYMVTRHARSFLSGKDQIEGQMTLTSKSNFDRAFTVRHEMAHLLITAYESEKLNDALADRYGKGSILAELAESVRSESHADAYAILSMAIEKGAAEAIQAGETVYKTRQRNGAFKMSTGYDTAHAIRGAIEQLKAGEVPSSEQDAILAALKLGDDSLKAYLSNKAYFDTSEAALGEALEGVLGQAYGGLLSMYKDSSIARAPTTHVDVAANTIGRRF